MNAIALPANLPNAATAKLPATYEAAKTALAECSRIDECADWANKAEALASYAKQADDDTLRKMADRIQARAIRRCGELLKQIDGRGDHMKNDGAVISRAEAAASAGMSERQRVTAVRVASIPAEDFEAQVESEAPPTITSLARQGTKQRTEHLQGSSPEAFFAATHTIGALKRFVEKCSEYDAAFVAAGVRPDEYAAARDMVARADAWLDRFIVSLKG